MGHDGTRADPQISDDPPVAALEQQLRAAGIAWAAGGPAQPLVDAAVDALIGGVDSPTLAVLAGSTRADADDEALDLAPRLFEELDLDVPARHSDDAVVDRAGWLAKEHLEGRLSADALGAAAHRLCSDNDWPEIAELWDLADLDDWYEVHGDEVGDQKAVAAARRVLDEAERRASIRRSHRREARHGAAAPHR